MKNFILFRNEWIETRIFHFLQYFVLIDDIDYQNHTRKMMSLFAIE